MNYESNQNLHLSKFDENCQIHLTVVFSNISEFAIPFGINLTEIARSKEAIINMASIWEYSIKKYQY